MKKYKTLIIIGAIAAVAAIGGFIWWKKRQSSSSSGDSTSGGEKLTPAEQAIADAATAAATVAEIKAKAEKICENKKGISHTACIASEISKLTAK